MITYFDTSALIPLLASEDLVTAIDALGGPYDQLDLLEIDDTLVRHTGDLAQRHELRGYDAIHLAAAERVASDTSILVAGDRDLCTAAGQLGMAVASTISDDEWSRARVSGGCGSPGMTSSVCSWTGRRKQPVETER